MTSIVNVYHQAVAKDLSDNHALHCVVAKNGSTLWVGNLESADKSFLRAQNISHVVNCTAYDLPQVRWTPQHEDGIQYAILISDDMADKPIQPGGQWDAIMTFLHKAWASKKNILIHCWAGKNRSVTTAAIFMVLEGLAKNFETAVQQIQDARPIANPDPIQREFGQKQIANQIEQWTNSNV